MDSCLKTYMTLQSSGLVRSGRNLKFLYLYYHNAHGHQTSQAGELPWGESILNATLPFLSRGIARSRDELKSLYLHHQIIYGHKTRQDSGLP